MSLLDVLRRHPVKVGAFAGAILGVVVGVFLPIRAPSTAPVSEQAWQLPTLASANPYTDAAAAGVRRASYWGAATAASVPAQLKWELRAILTRPSPRIAITTGARKDTVWIPLYGKLPDGSALVGVDRDTAWIERDGCRSARKLYPVGDEARADPCADAATAAKLSPEPGTRMPGSSQPQKKETP